MDWLLDLKDRRSPILRHAADAGDGDPDQASEPKESHFSPLSNCQGFSRASSKNSRLSMNCPGQFAGSAGTRCHVTLVDGSSQIAEITRNSDDIGAVMESDGTVEMST